MKRDSQLEQMVLPGVFNITPFLEIRGRHAQLSRSEPVDVGEVRPRRSADRYARLDSALILLRIFLGFRNKQKSASSERGQSRPLRLGLPQSEKASQPPAGRALEKLKHGQTTSNTTTSTTAPRF